MKKFSQMIKVIFLVNSIFFSLTVVAYAEDAALSSSALGTTKLAKPQEATDVQGNIDFERKETLGVASRRYKDLYQKGSGTGSAIGGSSTSTEEDEKPIGFQNPVAPNNPVDSLKGATFNEELVTAATAESDLATAMYTLGQTDPLALETRKAANQFGLNMVSAVEQASSRIEYELSTAGQAGEMFKMQMRNCVLQRTKEAIDAGTDGKKVYPQWSCINSRTQAGTTKVTSGGGGGGGATGSSVTENTGAASSEEAKLQRCGITDTQITKKADADCTSDAPTGNTVLAAIRLSYMLFPDDSASGSAADQQTKRTDFKKTFGDKCYVCSEGGKDSLDNDLPTSAVSYQVVDIKSTTEITETFYNNNKAVYNALAEILDKKCTFQTSSFGSTATDTKGDAIFHLKNDKGEVEATWDDGDFWRSSTALTGTISSGETIDQALGFMSFSGFHLTPSIIDAIYHSTVDKGTVPDATLNQNLCNDFTKYKDFDTVRTAVTEAAGTNEPLKKQIKQLYYFAQSIAAARTFDSCEQVLATISVLPVQPLMLQAATDKVLRVCSGDLSSPEGFSMLRNENLARVNKYVEELYQEIAFDSGRQGASVASSFKGEKSFSQKGTLN